MRCFALSLLAFTGLCSHLLGAVRTKVDLVNLTPEIKPGQTALIAARFRCDPHFHIYWKNPGDAGQAPSVTWSDKAGTTTSEFIWPGPGLLDQAGVMNFVYEAESLILIKVSIPDSARGDLLLKGKIEWLECDDAGCYPHEKEVTLALKVGGQNDAYKYDPKLYAELNPSLATTGEINGKTLRVTVPAGQKLKGTWFPERNFVTPNATFKQKHLGDTVDFSLVDATETLNSGPINFVTKTAEGGFVNIAVKIAAPAQRLDAPSNSSHGEWTPWSLEAQAKALAEGKIVYVDFTARWCATCQVNKRVYTQEAVLKALADHHVVMLKADWTKKDAVIAAELNKYGRTGIPLNIILKQGQPTAILSEALTGGEVISALEAVAAGKPYQASSITHPFVIWLLLAFGGGILLNLMPCVFPMIGLKVLAFAREAGASRHTVIKNGLLYSAGVIVSFITLAGLIIALKASGSSVGWGFQMQSPGFVLGTCVLMVVLGLSLAGTFEIGSSFAGIAAGAGDEGVGSFFSGILATAVATPCTAPGLGAALGFAMDKDRSTSETILFFTVIGLGMALPYLLLSIFPRLAALLPRPGEWMETLKQAMAFPLFAYALYLLWVLNALVDDAGWVRDASLGLALIAASCWILGRWAAPHRTDAERRYGRITAGLIFVGTLVYLFGSLP